METLFLLDTLTKKSATEIISYFRCQKLLESALETSKQKTNKQKRNKQTKTNK